MNLTLIKSAAAAALAISLIGGGFAWGLKWNASDIAQLKLEHANERIARDQANRAVAERRVAANRAAQLQAQVRAERTAVVVDGNLTELDRLHDITDRAVRDASASLEACAAHAAAQGGLLDYCAGRLVDVSAKADGHVSDIKTLMESE